MVAIEPKRPLRIVSVMEAHTVTGVAKALLAFYKQARFERRADITILTFARGSRDISKPNQFVSAIRALGFSIETIPETSAVDVRAALRLRDALRRLGPDLIETHAVKSHVLMRLSKPGSLAWAAFHHGYTHQDLKMKIYNRLNPWALCGADAVVTVCQPFARQLANTGVLASKMHVVPNAIEPMSQPSGDERRTAARKQFGIPLDCQVILSIGRLSAEKGHRFLLDALKQGRGTWKLLLVGDGPERHRLQEQATRLGIEDNVLFCGHQTDPLPFYAAADLFVLPSLTEGSPMVLLEAMQMQTPIVATAVGGVPEMVIDGRSALLVPAADAGHLAAAVTRLLDDRVLSNRLRVEAYRDVSTGHTPEAYAHTLLGIYAAVRRGSR